MAERVSVKEAAEILGVSELTVRWGIRQGTLPIGFYVQIPGSKRTVYHISPGLLNKYLGKEAVKYAGSN